jgi:hypothetical protein
MPGPSPDRSGLSATTGMVFVKAAFIHTGPQQGVVLKIQHLPVTVRGHGQ